MSVPKPNLTPDAVQALQSILAGEKDALESLLTLSRQKQDVLIQGDAVALGDIVQAERGLLACLSDFSRRRGELCKCAGERAQADLFVSGDPSGRLTLLHRQLVDIASQLSRQNETDRRLIETHLEYTDFCLNLLTEAQSVATGYDKRGATRSDTVRSLGLIDQKA